EAGDSAGRLACHLSLVTCHPRHHLPGLPTEFDNRKRATIAYIAANEASELMKIFDVTVPISKELPVYPGDPAVQIERKATIGKTDSKYNLSGYCFGSHMGTHVDAPFHFIENGITVDKLPLELLMGRARVVEVTSPRIDETALQEFDFTPDARVLFKTRN